MKIFKTNDNTWENQHETFVYNIENRYELANGDGNAIDSYNAATDGFRQLIAGADAKGVVIARFLAVLELYRHAAISFEQLEPLGELTLRWTAQHWNEEQLATLGADYDQ